MIAKELITDRISPLEYTDTGEIALQWMNDCKVSHLSVMKNNSFVGIVSEDELLSKVDLSKMLTELFEHLPRPYVKENTHIYEILNLAATDNLTTIPVLDEDENYLGSIDLLSLVHYFSSIGAVKDQGGVIVIEMSETDYSLAHISQIIEAENAKILSSFVSSNPLSKKLELTLKINRVELGRIIKDLIRHDYFVKASFQRDSFHDDLKNRYDELMNFLNI